MLFNQESKCYILLLVFFCTLFDGYSGHESWITTGILEADNLRGFSFPEHHEKDDNFLLAGNLYKFHSIHRRALGDGRLSSYSDDSIKANIKLAESLQNRTRILIKKFHKHLNQLRKEDSLVMEKFGDIFAKLKRLETGEKLANDAAEKEAKKQIAESVKKIKQKLNAKKQSEVEESVKLKNILGMIDDLETVYLKRNRTIGNSEDNVDVMDKKGFKDLEKAAEKIKRKLKRLEEEIMKIVNLLHILFRLNLNPNHLAIHLEELAGQAGMIKQDIFYVIKDIKQLDTDKIEKGNLEAVVKEVIYQLNVLEKDLDKGEQIILNTVNYGVDKPYNNFLHEIRLLSNAFKEVASKVSSGSNNPKVLKTTPIISVGGKEGNESIHKNVLYIEKQIKIGKIIMKMENPHELESFIELEIALAVEANDIASDWTQYVGRAFHLELELAKAVNEKIREIALSHLNNKTVNSDPSWTSWGSWSSCSVTCGGDGVRQRTRICIVMSISLESRCPGMSLESGICSANYSCSLYRVVFCEDGTLNTEKNSNCRCASKPNHCLNGGLCIDKMEKKEASANQNESRSTDTSYIKRMVCSCGFGFSGPICEDRWLFNLALILCGILIGLILTWLIWYCCTHCNRHEEKVQVEEDLAEEEEIAEEEILEEEVIPEEEIIREDASFARLSLKKSKAFSQFDEISGATGDRQTPPLEEGIQRENTRYSQGELQSGYEKRRSKPSADELSSTSADELIATDNETDDGQRAGIPKFRARIMSLGTRSLEQLKDSREPGPENDDGVPRISKQSSRQSASMKNDSISQRASQKSGSILSDLNAKGDVRSSFRRSVMGSQSQPRTSEGIQSRTSASRSVRQSTVPEGSSSRVFNEGPYSRSSQSIRRSQLQASDAVFQSQASMRGSYTGSTSPGFDSSREDASSPYPEGLQRISHRFDSESEFQINSTLIGDNEFESREFQGQDFEGGEFEGREPSVHRYPRMSALPRDDTIRRVESSQRVIRSNIKGHEIEGRVFEGRKFEGRAIEGREPSMHRNPRMPAVPRVDNIRRVESSHRVIRDDIKGRKFEGREIKGREPSIHRYPDMSALPRVVDNRVESSQKQYTESRMNNDLRSAQMEVKAQDYQVENRIPSSQTEIGVKNLPTHEQPLLNSSMQNLTSEKRYVSFTDKRSNSDSNIPDTTEIYDDDQEYSQDMDPTGMEQPVKELYKTEVYYTVESEPIPTPLRCHGKETASSNVFKRTYMNSKIDYFSPFCTTSEIDQNMITEIQRVNCGGNKQVVQLRSESVGNNSAPLSRTGSSLGHSINQTTHGNSMNRRPYANSISQISNVPERFSFRPRAAKVSRQGYNDNSNVANQFFSDSQIMNQDQMSLNLVPSVYERQTEIVRYNSHVDPSLVNSSALTTTNASKPFFSFNSPQIQSPHQNSGIRH